MPVEPDAVSHEELFGLVQAPMEDSLTQCRILIVDDSQLMLSIITKYLNMYGYEDLRQAKDGAEALRIAECFRPDLILTDIQMPVMDGYELCQRVRNHPLLEDIPLLVLTGVDKAEDRTAVFSAGATDLLTKPVDRMELIGRLRVHLERRRLIKRLSEFKARMAQELEMARSMQEALLPADQVLSDLEATYPVSFRTHYEASDGLGGDLWDVHKLDDHRLMLYLIDFSGHGVGAALNTFRFQSYFSNVKLDTKAPAEILQETNTFLKLNLQTGQFATMYCAEIDFSANSLVFASASAPPALLKVAGTRDGYRPLPASGYPLGVLANARFESIRVPFPPGSSLMLYSDALIETPDPPESVFTADSLSAFLNSAHGLDASDPVRLVLDKLRQLHPDNPDDDLTLVSIDHLDKPHSGGDVQ